MLTPANPTALQRLRRDLAFARHLRPGQVTRRLWLEARRRVCVALLQGRPLRPARLALGPDLPPPLFAPRTGMVERRREGWRFTFLNRQVDFPKRIPWTMPEAGPRDQLWKMNLHYMEYLEEVDDEAFAELVGDWIERNRPYAAGYWRDSWNSYTLSLRTVVWLQQLGRRRDRLPADLVARMTASLEEQLHFLARHLETDIGGNHLIKNIKALLWASACFTGPEAALWRRKGTALLARELDEQILLDGVHFERSPSYHCQVMADLLECHHALAWSPRTSTAASSDSSSSDSLSALHTESAPASRRRGRQGDQREAEHLSPQAGQVAGRHQGTSSDRPRSDEVSGRLADTESASAGRRRGRQGDRRAVEWTSMSTDRPQPDEVFGRLARALHGMAQATADLSHPDGYVALFGDSGLTMAYAPGECLAVHTKLLGRRVTPRRHIALPDAGYYGYRDGGLYFLCDCGPICPDHLPAHGHGDALSFELSVGGQRLIVDPGVFEYNAGDARDRSRAAASHNTVSVDGMDQGDFHGAFRCGWRARPRVLSYDEHADGFTLHASTTLADSTGRQVEHRRCFALSAQDLSIADELLPASEARATFSLLFHPGCTLENGAGSLNVQRGEATLAIEGLTLDDVEQGSFSLDHGQSVPASRLALPLTGSRTVNLALSFKSPAVSPVGGGSVAAAQ